MIEREYLYGNTRVKLWLNFYLSTIYLTWYENQGSSIVAAVSILYIFTIFYYPLNIAIQHSVLNNIIRLWQTNRFL